ncbi:uncharacterized protein LOC106460906 [Limulus polyphemus]|uniref:Uncharacterized protein LOC106460906 n=1 Tax=Limulus polyphemus TaxID=6850 RepID=A0ABM1SIG4_LIMPO|nr:uncharacterized protein LOC106460906 [Limulus polyphemus]
MNLLTLGFITFLTCLIFGFVSTDSTTSEMEESPNTSDMTTLGNTTWSEAESTTWTEAGNVTWTKGGDTTWTEAGNVTWTEAGNVTWTEAGNVTWTEAGNVTWTEAGNTTITLSPGTGNTTETTANPTHETPEPGSKKLSKGAIAGIVISVILGCSVIVGGVIWLIRRQKRKEMAGNIIGQ